MSLYYEAAEILTGPDSGRGGSLKNRIFSKEELKSPPAQIYALVIESLKWSSVLKEVVENTGLLKLEHKITPLLALFLVHDLLLARKGIALPATHGLRSCIERHKARLQSELTKARVKRHMGSMEALKEYIESGGDNTSGETIAPHPRWVRINTLRTKLEDQLASTFKGFERTPTVNGVRKRGVKCIYIDEHVPNLVAIPASVDLTKSEAYNTGAIIFQDKASCFPAYLLDPLPEDGDVIDSCAAPGNKTTHAAAIMMDHASKPNHFTQKLFAFEKNKLRAETLKKMVSLADSEKFTLVHGGHDFLKVDPNADKYKNVGALLLDPSCSGSGIVGRDEMPELHLPDPKADGPKKFVDKNIYRARKPKPKAAAPKEEEKSSKRKRAEDDEPEMETFVDDDGDITAITSGEDLQKRLNSLSAFQLTLLLHAMTFPAARKITYSTCSTHFEENENVVLQALNSDIAKGRGWRILKREEQVRGMRQWPVRGLIEGKDSSDEVVDACIRANKGDEHGTMGFFLAGLVRDGDVEADAETFAAVRINRDEKGSIVRDVTETPILKESKPAQLAPKNKKQKKEASPTIAKDEEWGGIKEEVPQTKKPTKSKGSQQKQAASQSKQTSNVKAKPVKPNASVVVKQAKPSAKQDTAPKKETVKAKVDIAKPKTSVKQSSGKQSQPQAQGQENGGKQKEAMKPKAAKTARPAGLPRPNLLSGQKKKRKA